MRVFITGIEGFVGAHLARYLADRAHQVSGIYFVDPLADLSFARISKCDVRDAGKLADAVAQSEPDSIVHLAAVSSVVMAEQDLTQTFHINVRGTLNLLEAARLLKSQARVLLVSSSEVYDRPGNGGRKLDESSALKPMNHYSISKLCSEQLGRYYFDRYGLDVVILRPFSHTGPGQSLNFVFPSVARQIAEAEAGQRKPEIEVGNTSVSRDYTDIRDICAAYELALAKAGKGEVYNITSEHVLRIGDGIRYLISLSRVPIEIKVAASRIRQESVLLTGSSAKFRSVTGWRPHYDFKQTLADLLNREREQVARI